MNYCKNGLRALCFVLSGLFVVFSGSLQAASTSIVPFVPKSSSSSSSLSSAFAQTVSDASASLMRHSLVLKGAPQGRRHSEPHLSALPTLTLPALHPLDLPSSPELERKVQAADNHPAVLLEDRKREAAQTHSVAEISVTDVSSGMAPQARYTNMQCPVCHDDILNEKNVTVRSCGHFLHTDPCCIKAMHQDTRCVTCRAQLAPETLAALQGLAMDQVHNVILEADLAVIADLTQRINVRLDAFPVLVRQRRPASRLERLYNYMQNNRPARYLMYAGTLATMAGLRKGIKSDGAYGCSATLTALLSAGIGGCMNNSHDCAKSSSLAMGAMLYIMCLSEKGLVKTIKDLPSHIYNAGGMLGQYGLARICWGIVDRFNAQRTP